MDDKRQTGRTTRMLLEALRLCDRGRAVYVIAANEQERVRDLLPMYDAIPTGIFAATMMRQSLAMAEQAAASGDIVAMIAAYKDLKGYKS